MAVKKSPYCHTKKESKLRIYKTIESIKKQKRSIGLFNHNKLQKKTHISNMEILHGNSKKISRIPKEKLLRRKQKIHRREKTVDYEEEVYVN